MQGIVICVGGLGMLVASDELTDKDWPALSRAKGDVFMLVGATLYGFSTCMCRAFAAKIVGSNEGYSQRDGGVFRPPLPVVRGRRSARHVGHVDQRHPSRESRALRHDAGQLEWCHQ